MADIVTTQIITDTSGVKFVVKLTNLSDGSGETDVIKVDASETSFMTEDGARKIAKVWYSINTTSPKSGVEIKWDGATDATALFLGGQGYIDLRTAGDEIINNAITPTGDVLLSTKSFLNGDNYMIIIEFR